MEADPVQALGQAFMDAEDQYFNAARRHRQAKKRCDVLELEVMVFTEDGRGYEAQCNEARAAMNEAAAEREVASRLLNEATDALSEVHPALVALEEMDEGQQLDVPEP